MNDANISAIPGVETFLITPGSITTTLRISIARPPNQAIRKEGEGKQSIIYVTDADYSFGTVVEAARIGYIAGELGPAIIVGIGYAQECGDYAFVGRRRGLDFYRGPRRSVELPGVGTQELGGAESFLSALIETVIPEIDRRVPAAADGRRILYGMSAGGHFTAYTLIQQPHAFDGYAMMSPALIDFPPAPGAEQMVEAVRAMPIGTIPPETRVFLSAGAREEDPGESSAAASIISNAYRMRAALTAHGVSTEFAVFANETHISVLGAAVTRSLRFLVPPQS